MTLKEQMISDLSTVFFNEDDFAISGVYSPASGADSNISIIIDESVDALQSPQPPGDEMIIFVMESEVAAPNKEGDSFVINGETWYLVKNLSGSVGQGIWRLLLSRSARRML